MDLRKFVLWLCLCTGAGAQAPRPEPGLWYNPERSGHGVDFQFAGSTLVGIWYTYDVQGLPTWYIASGAYAGTTWSAPLLSARWDGSAATLTQVGTLGLQVHADDRAELTWNLGGDTGSEPFERLRYGAGAPTANLTGIYHHAAQTGWGLSFEVQGSTAAAVLYFYDVAGRPRWVLGTGAMSAAGAPKSGAAGIAMNVFQGGFPSNSPYVGPPLAAPAGTLSLVDGQLDIEVLLPGGLGGWQRNVPGSRLTDAGPPFLFAHIEGPAIIPAGASVPYSARFDTNLASIAGLQYQWTVFYGDRVTQANTTTIAVQPMGSEGLVSLQLDVTDPASGASAFATINVSAQLDDLFDVTIVPEYAELLAGRPNRFNALVLGGRSPYTYEWSGSHIVQDGYPDVYVWAPCEVVGTSELRVSVRDADGREASARLPIEFRPVNCQIAIRGPECTAHLLLVTFTAEVEGRPRLTPGRPYAWSSSLGDPGPGCRETVCQVIGPEGGPTDFFTLRVDHPVYGFAERRIARECPNGPRMTMRPRPPTLAPEGGSIALDFEVSGGTPPYFIRLRCDHGIESHPEGGGATQTGVCRYEFPPGVPTLPIIARVYDSTSLSHRQQVAIPVVATTPPVQASLTAPSAPDTCLPTSFAIAISQGTAPFDISLDFGDGSPPHTERTSSRALMIAHEYAPSSAGAARTARLVVTDAVAARAEQTSTLTPRNQAVDVNLVLRNNAFENIHIYDRSRDPGTWFLESTRITPGSVRDDSLRIPADACEAQVEWGAGRAATQLVQLACTYRKSQPNAGVSYSETGGAALNCD